MTKLRHYQQQTKDELYDHFARGLKRVMIAAPTGSGKGVVMSSIARDAFDYDMHVILIVKRRELIGQASKHFSTWEIPHGVYMANHRHFRPSDMVQICSIDTLDARKIYPHAEKDKVLVIIDECHDSGSNQYKKVFDAYSKHNIVGLTATPFSDNSMWEAYSKPIEAITLMQEGFLAPDRIYVPDMIDVTGVKSYKGEYVNDQLAMACSKSSVIGDVIKNWRKYGAGKRTILFAVNVEHSKLLCEQLNKAGIRALHCDANSKSKDRDKAIQSLKDHTIDVLCNVNIFSTGLDIPEIECISFCRPTQSIIYWIQAVGRGLRPAPWIGKKDCIIIDHAGNTIRHGSVYTPREISLEPKKKGKKDEDDISIRYCKQCFYVFQAHESCCPDCGYKNPKQERKISEKDGELVAYQMSDAEKEKIREASFKSQFHKLSHVAKRRNFKDNWVFFQLVKTEGIDSCRKYGKAIDFPRNILLRG